MIKSYIKEKHYTIVLNQKTIAKMRPNLHWELNVFFCQVYNLLLRDII